MRRLSLRWGISRAADYEGQNIVTVRDSATRKMFRQYGGGYDLERVALCEWLQVTFQEQLRAIRSRARVVYRGNGPTEHRYNDAPDALLAMGTFPNADAVVIDAGRDSDVDKVAAAIGLTITPLYKTTRRRKTRIGWEVTGD